MLDGPNHRLERAKESNSRLRTEQQKSSNLMKGKENVSQRVK